MRTLAWCFLFYSGAICALEAGQKLLPAPENSNIVRVMGLDEKQLAEAAGELMPNAKAVLATNRRTEPKFCISDYYVIPVDELEKALSKDELQKLKEWKKDTKSKQIFFRVEVINKKRIIVSEVNPLDDRLANAEAKTDPKAYRQWMLVLEKMLMEGAKVVTFRNLEAIFMAPEHGAAQ